MVLRNIVIFYFTWNNVIEIYFFLIFMWNENNLIIKMYSEWGYDKGSGEI